jgi:hypothetical protein
VLGEAAWKGHQVVERDGTGDDDAHGAGSRFRVQGSGFKVPGSRFRVQGSGFKVQGSRF